MLIPDIAAAVGIDLAQDRDLFDHITFRMRKDGEIERVAPRRYRLSADYNHTERARRPALDSLEVRAANGDSQIAHKLGLGVDEQPAERAEQPDRPAEPLTGNVSSEERTKQPENPVILAETQVSTRTEPRRRAPDMDSISPLEVGAVDQDLISRPQ
jgi:hypothetical protein